MYRSARELWTASDALRQGLITRCQAYAALTIPKVCHETGFNQIASDDTHDYQSLGAQAVTHVCNKLMIAMFAPSRPFIKLLPGKKAAAQAQQLQVTKTQLDQVLANGERQAIGELDRRGQRPRLFQVLRHLVVTGNVMMVLDEKKGIRAIGIKNYIVKRNIWGEVLHLVIREQLKFDELDPAIVSMYRQKYQDDQMVDFFKWVKREPSGAYSMSQWLDNSRLPKEYDGRWPSVTECPYQALTWDLADEADYGTGLVEEYRGDLEAISALSESVVDGAILGTEYRWMANPAGQTSVEDVQNSENGDVLPGLATDLAPVQGGNPNAITVAVDTLDRYERRVSRGFLMGSAVIRDAERVTQEEVRLTANELETAYGGVYSTLAGSLQLPVARWLCKSIDLKLKEADLDVTIVTGLDALSRNGDLDNFRFAMGDMASIASVPENLQSRIKWEEVAAFIGQGRNIDMARFLLSDAEFADMQAQQAADRVGEQVITTAGNAAVQGPQ